MPRPMFATCDIPKRRKRGSAEHSRRVISHYNAITSGKGDLLHQARRSTVSLVMKTYPLALDLWDAGSSVVIRSTNGTRIASFPLDFISRGGDNTWSYVLYVIDQLIISESGRGRIIKDEHGRVLDPNESPSAGEFVFSLEGKLPTINATIETIPLTVSCLL